MLNSLQAYKDEEYNQLMENIYFFNVSDFRICKYPNVFLLNAAVLPMCDNCEV